LGPSIRIAIDEASQTAEARRAGQRIAEESGFDSVRAGRVALVVTEACTNILKHARAGEILLQVTEPSREGDIAELQLLSLDRGPGIGDIDRCFEDGFSTGGTPGQGLGAIRRLAEESDFYSVPGEGTAILARWSLGHGTSRPLPLRAGAVNTSKRGEEFCCDAWGVEQSDGFFTLLLADGLGHGYEASQASLEAVRILRNNTGLAPGRLLELIHQALRGFRGAAVSVARIDLDRGVLTFAGLGNVMGQIYSGPERSQHLVSVNGTAGLQAGKIREFSYAWPAEGILLMHSDGLTTGAGLHSSPRLAQRDPTLIAGVLYRDFARGHDDATIVVAKAA
jgi:anti-sigma regulatory factor (Ser/Thr protein kinase)